MPSISTYFSLAYLVFLLLSVVVYACSPQKARRWVLLIFSYLFFISASGILIGYLLFSILSMYKTGLWLSAVQKECSMLLKSAEKGQKKAITAKYLSKQRKILALAALFQIGILLLLKYTPFAIANINHIFFWLGLPFSMEIPSFLIPIGISFYTLQAMSYLFDVYRKKITADGNLLRLALYMSFFPQIMEGPICRYTDTADSLWTAEKITYRNFIAGVQRILFGIMKKLILADRLNLFIENVFSQYGDYDGFVIALGAVCYTLQLYMDFSGTMDVVIGSAQIFWVKLPENFQRPFFSATISEFWKRWHITLGTWFKDYIFFPVSMSGSMKKLTSRARKKLGNHFGPLIAGGVSLFCVWLCNGLWHGAGWHYIFFGMYHFSLILGGSIIEPAVIQATQKMNIRRSSFPYRCMQIIRTCILVCVGELFFRAHGLLAGLKMFKKIFTDFSFATLKDGSLFTYGMDEHDYLIILLAVLLILVIGILQERGVHIRKTIAKKSIALQYAIYYALILFIIIFGAYGIGYVPVDPIYAGF